MLETKIKRQMIIATGNGRLAPVVPLPVLLLGLLVASHPGEAQSVLIPQPPTEPVQPAWQPAQTNEFNVFEPAGLGTATLSDAPWRWGSWLARPHVIYRLLYGAGIQSSPGHQQNTVINELSPGSTFDLGRHWTLDYTPTLRFYSNHHFTDEFDNAVSLTWATAYEDWDFGFTQSFVSSSAPQAETATQTSENIYQTRLSADYAFNDKLSLDLGIGQNIQTTEGFQNSRDWSTSNWLNYHFGPRLNVGIGAGFGYANVDFGPDQTYENLSGRINWRADDKISLELNAGFEERQFLTPGGNDLFNPTFGAAIQYQLFKNTQISLNAGRSVNTSYFQSQVTEDTSISCNLNQRLWRSFNLDVGGGYHLTQYAGSTGSVSANRQDDYYTLNLRLSHPFLKRGTLAIIYQYGDDSSTASGFTYSSSQIGVEISYRY